jgi:hypothetical protein
MPLATATELVLYARIYAKQNYLLFKITTQIIVIQKNGTGQVLVSIIASITVTIKTTTAILMLQTILVVKLPLKWDR